MATDDRKAWQRPGFIVAAAVIVLVLALGVAAIIRSMGQSEADPTPTPTPTATSSEPTTATTTAEPTEEPSAADASTCGLESVELEGGLSAAPETTWDYVGVIAMPSVAGQGPGQTSAEGLRTCYAHTPTGAVLAYANFLTQTNSADLRAAAFDYFTAQGAGRDAAVAGAGELAAGGSDLSIAGFRVLSYEGDEALVDVAVQVVAQGQTAFASSRANLLWQDGDWRWLPAEDGSEEYEVVVIPSVADYIAWTAS